MKQDLINLGQHAIQYAKTKGCAASICKVITSANNEFIGEQKNLSSINSSDQVGFGVTVHIGQKKGTASTNIVNKEKIEATVEQAIAIAKFSKEDPFLTITPLELAPKAQELSFLWDEGYSSIDKSVLSSYLKESIKQLHSYPEMALDRISLNINKSEEFYFNSNGVQQSERQSAASWSMLGMGKKGDFVTGMDWKSGFSYKKDLIQEKMHNSCESFIERIKLLLQKGASQSYEGGLIISPRCVEDLFLGIPLGHMSGRAVMDNRSKFQDDEFGQHFHESINVEDCPHLPELSSATSYDLEGIPSQNRQLIKNGKINGFLYDNYSGKKLGKTTSGIAGGPFGLKMAAGNASLESMLNSQKNILLIERFSGNSDFTTGNISGVAKSSSFYSDGKFQGIVDETMIAANVFEMIKNVVSIENISHLTDDSGYFPHILVDGVTVSAG